MKEEKIKQIVRETYTRVVESGEKREDRCGCSTGCCDDISGVSFSLDYGGKDGYFADADFGLGCGLPLEHAAIKKGDRVLDLGSGAGNDCFVAAAAVGPGGGVTGLDFTPLMIKNAEENLARTGFRNISFVAGEIDNMPFHDNSFDVAISNCVINLVPDKKRAFSEIYRVLVEGGHFSISDIVLDGELPAAIVKAAELYAGCVSGAMQKAEYLRIISESGFSDSAVIKERELVLPDELLLKYINFDELQNYRSSGRKILSVTITANK